MKEIIFSYVKLKQKKTSPALKGRHILAKGEALRNKVHEL